MVDDKKKKTFERLARAGFAARGVVYGLIGILALTAAFGSGGETTGQTGALQALAQNPLGIAVLALVAIGLFGYAVWRTVEGALDLENQGSDAKGKAKRAAHIGSGIFHAFLGVTAVTILFGNGGGDSGGAASWTREVMEAPFGRILVGIGGIIGFIAAGAQVKKAVREEYRSHTRIPDRAGWVNRAIKAGLFSRAAIFAIVGGFLVFAAFTANADNARGLDGALSWVQNQSYGGVLLALIAAGLVAFAFFSFLQVRYRFIPDPEANAS